MITLDQQKELVQKKMAIAKYDMDRGLVLFKYHRNVMYDYLWFQYPELRECRGHVYDLYTGAVVQAAPRKSFNYGENGWWHPVSLDTDVRLYKKFNGFMACSTVHNGMRIITTTGSFTSEFQLKAEELIIKAGALCSNTWTDLFEIISDDDPHIVDEGEERAVYLGSRNKETGEFRPAPNTFKFEGKLKNALEFVREDHWGEGYMMYNAIDQDMLNPAKLKTNHYIGMKALMRANKNKVQSMYNAPSEFAKSLPDVYACIPSEICKSIVISDWFAFDEQTRRKYIEIALEK